MEDLELTGTCPLIIYTGSDEYQLPTQKQLQKLATQDSIKKCGSKNNFKITDKILRLYNTPTEREIPLKRARSIAAKNARNGHENPYMQKELTFPILENNKSTISRQTDILQLSNSLVNDCLKRSEHQRVKQSPLALVNTDDSCSLINDRPFVSQLNVLEKIRPSHPQFAKEIKVNPGEALKINSLILAERLKVQLTPASQHRITFPHIANTSQPNTATPKYW
jgi:hypothetical protein